MLFFHYKKLMIPAAAVIAANLLAGASVRSESDLMTQLLKERTVTLQQAYDRTLTPDQAEERLQEIETQPLLREDVKTLREFADTELDFVEGVEIRKLKVCFAVFGKKGYDAEILWYMNGMNGRYLQEQDYYILLDGSGKRPRLSKFDPR